MHPPLPTTFPFSRPQHSNLPYSRKLSRELTFANPPKNHFNGINFREFYHLAILYRIYNFANFIFANLKKIMKRAKVIGLESFRLYGILVFFVLSYTNDYHSPMTCQVTIPSSPTPFHGNPKQCCVITNNREMLCTATSTATA